MRAKVGVSCEGSIHRVYSVWRVGSGGRSDGTNGCPGETDFGGVFSV